MKWIVTILTVIVMLASLSNAQWNSPTPEAVVANGTFSGDPNYIPYFQNTTDLINSVLCQNGSSIGLGTCAPARHFEVNGAAADTRIYVRSTGTHAMVEVDSAAAAHALFRFYAASALQWSIGKDNNADFYISDNGGNVMTIDQTTRQFDFPTATTAAAGICMGGDACMHRSAADEFTFNDPTLIQNAMSIKKNAATSAGWCVNRNGWTGAIFDGTKSAFCAIDIDSRNTLEFQVYAGGGGTTEAQAIVIGNTGRVSFGGTVNENGEQVQVNGGMNVTNNITGNYHYAEMWASHSAVISLPASSTYANVTNLTSTRLNGFTHDNGSLTSLINGLLKVDAQIAFSGTANQEYHLQFVVNGVAANNCHTERVIGSGGDVGSASITCFCPVNANDVLQLQMENIDSANDPTIHDLNINVLRIGD